MSVELITSRAIRLSGPRKLGIRAGEGQVSPPKPDGEMERVALVSNHSPQT